MSVSTSVPAQTPIAVQTPMPSQSAAQPSVQTSFTTHTLAETQDTSAEAENISYIKPAYTADQLKKFKEQGSTAQLLFIAQAYVGKPLSVNDIKTIYFMQDILHFSDDLIDYLIQYCVERGKKDFRYMEKVAINWAEEGITTPKQAQAVSSRYDKSVYSVMNALGKSGTPTNKELEYINRWTKEYGFSSDVIIEACERTVLATDKHRFEYADKILSSWKQENVHHKADIISLDNHYQKQRSTASKQPSNRFNQFSQNTYDFEALEKELLSN
jgi:DnaD/phage-associated family protein